jgi:hypothetical protein
MGGSGRFWGREINPAETIEKLRKSQKSTEIREFESDVAAEIANLLSGCERDVKAVNTHLEEIRRALSSDIDGSVDFTFGGSVAKNTFVDGLSDIDTLIILNKSELKNKTPKEVLDYFLDRMRARFPKSNIDKGNLAITISFSDMEIQILPAIRTKGGVYIPSGDRKNWSFIQPKKFQGVLSDANKNSNAKIIPTIKLAKTIIRCFPEKRQLQGYHTEVLAINILKEYKGEYNLKNMLKYFFQNASQKVLTPIKDITGQNRNVDSYLGREKSLQRKLASDSLANIARRMENADLACSSIEWKNILRGL